MWLTIQAVSVKILQDKRGGITAMKTKTMILCAVFAAILCVFSVMIIPIGPVPVSMGLFGIMIAAGILGLKRGTIAVAVFILIGAVGVPVFTGFRGGLAPLAGPTGGYIWSYVPMTALIGALTLKTPKNKWLAMNRYFFAFLAGVALCYAMGTAQFMVVQEADFKTALGLCVLPFIPFDIAKALAASYISYTVRRALMKAGIF